MACQNFASDPPPNTHTYTYAYTYTHMPGPCQSFSVGFLLKEWLTTRMYTAHPSSKNHWLASVSSGCFNSSVCWKKRDHVFTHTQNGGESIACALRTCGILGTPQYARIVAEVYKFPAHKSLFPSENPDKRDICWLVETEAHPNPVLPRGSWSFKFMVVMTLPKWSSFFN